jgi:hypothetical protein
MYLVLDPEGVSGAPEVVTVTAHTASSTTVTVTRGSQSSTARQHAAGTTWRHTTTQADLSSFLTGVPDNAVTTAKILDDAVTTAKILDANVTTNKLNNLAVTNAKLGNQSVTHNKLHLMQVEYTRNATQSIPANGNAYVSFTGSLAFTGWGTPTLTTLTCPDTGIYLFTGRLLTSNHNFHTMQFHSGAPVTVYYNNVSSAKSLSHVMYMTAGETILWQVMNSNGTTALDFTAQLNIFRLYTQL